jgi:hypothetical protein
VRAQRNAASPLSMPAIAENRRARFEYHIEERYEAGMVLQGWEIKAIRAGQVQLTDGYVVIRDGELYLIGCRINALRSASTHVHPEADRTKKLLMRKEEIKRLVGKVEQRASRWCRWTCITRAGGSRSRSRWPRARPRTTSARPRRSATGNARRAG